MDDALTARYGDLLTGTYDCVDRNVLNAYFSMGSRRAVSGRGGAGCTGLMRTSTTPI